MSLHHFDLPDNEDVTSAPFAGTGGGGGGDVSGRDPDHDADRKQQQQKVLEPRAGEDAPHARHRAPGGGPDVLRRRPGLQHVRDEL